MKKTVLIGCILLMVFTASYCFAQMGGGMMGGEQGQMMEPGQAEKQQPKTLGGKIFGENCESCHPDGGNTIVPDLPLKGSRILANFRTFEAFIRNPKMPDGSQGSMPSFGKSKISDRQARELYHFITSTEGAGLRGGPGMGQGRMRGYGMGPEMMGGYDEEPGMMEDYDMGPGMMGGYRGGPGMMEDYGMGPEMMGGYRGGRGMMGGCGMGYGRMGYYSQSPECQKFYDSTTKLRKELHDKRFEYFEVLRNPKATGQTAMKLDKEIRELQEKIFANAPLGCTW